jgi:hypothetical protein
VADRTRHDLLDDDLVGGEVELHLGELRRRIRTAIGDPSFRGRVAATVATAPERRLVDDELDPGLLTHPLADRREDRLQLFRRLRSALDHGEVEILGEAVRLVEALAQTGAALEDPGICEVRVVAMPASSQPST